jgi:hypothetical protein
MTTCIHGIAWDQTCMTCGRLVTHIAPSEPVELAALEAHTDPDGHLWQPAGTDSDGGCGKHGSITAVIAVVALCPCGAVRRFEVPA